MTVLCTVVALLAFIVLAAGWLLDIEGLRVFSPAWSPMAPLTAVLLLLVSGGSGFYQRRQTLSNVLLGVAFVIGAAVLISYFTNVRLGLHPLSMLFHRGSQAPLPELPAPDAAAAFMLIAVALFCMRTRSILAHDFADLVAVTIVMVCLQVLVEYVYNIAHFTAITGFRQIAPHSTFAVILLAVTVIANRPTDGIFTAVTEPAPSALLLRRLLPIAVVACLLVGLLAVEALRSKVGSVPDVVAWSVTGGIVVLALLLFVTSGEMRKAEATVLKRESELIEARNAAQAASNTKSRFMAVMSHELRTPLTAMLGYTDLLDAGVAGSLTPEGRKFVERIRTSGWHLVGLIDAVLMYASGRPALEQVRSEGFDVAAMLREITELFESQAREKGIAITLESPQSVLVLSEHSRLRKILINLIGNSVKFTERGGVSVRVNEFDDVVTIEIADTGIGIADEHLAHIWEPFEQVDEPHTREQGGMGLGMALTRMLADQLAIPIMVRSKVGEGSSFTLQLPSAVNETPAEVVRLDGKRVLVVDDEMTVRRIMARSLARYGAAIVEARDGEDALGQMNGDGTFDVIVTDISMPGMTGIELARTIRAQAGAPPVVFVTGAELSDAERAEIEQIGGVLLNKPFDMSELARVVSEA